MSHHPRVSGFREDISPYDEHNQYPSVSSAYSAHPPSYQQWPELHHNVSPPDPSEPSFPRKQSPIGDISVSSPGLESVWAGEGDKEVIPEALPPIPVEPRATNANRICGLKRWMFWVILVGAVVVAIALGVGLGVGLGLQNKHKSSSSSPSATTSASGGAPTSSPALSSDYYIGGALNPSYYSKTGAFNGTGLALASQSFGSGDYGELVLYFQHHSGSVRWQRLTPDAGWVGGSESEIVASDAKNSTPLSAVAYSLNGTSTWHLFYIDKKNVLREKINSNATNIWQEGPLSGENHTVLDADQAGMQACWYGNDYGDVDYKHTPLPNEDSGSSNTTDGNTDIGMHMWYASDAGTFQQLGWRHGDSNWTWQQSWEKKNGHAGVACYSWGGTSTTYVMFVNQANTAEVWWKDTDTNKTSTNEHPINEWMNTSVAVNNLHPSTSLGYTNAFYAQSQDNWIRGYNISWASENTTIIGNPFRVDLSQGIPGTHMSVTALPDSSGGNSLAVFYQQDGEDITYATRDLYQGTWTAAPLTVPDP